MVRKNPFYYVIKNESSMSELFKHGKDKDNLTRNFDFGDGQEDGGAKGTAFLYALACNNYPMAFTIAEQDPTILKDRILKDWNAVKKDDGALDIAIKQNAPDCVVARIFDLYSINNISMSPREDKALSSWMDGKRSVMERFDALEAIHVLRDGYVCPLVRKTDRDELKQIFPDNLDIFGCFEPHAMNNDVIQKICDAGFDLNIMDANNRTPLVKTAELKNVNGCHILAKTGRVDFEMAKKNALLHEDAKVHQFIEQLQKQYEEQKPSIIWSHNTDQIVSVVHKETDGSTTRHRFNLRTGEVTRLMAEVTENGESITFPVQSFSFDEFKDHQLIDRAKEYFKNKTAIKKNV